VSLDPQADEGRQAQAGLRPADLGTVALDDAAGLERLDPAQAGRRRERDRVGEIDVGDAAVPLQGTQDGTIDAVCR
jgi:hypothetical protein